MYCVDFNNDEPIMLINKHIGYDAEDGMGIDGSLFQAELLQLDGMGKKRIQVWINSPGGVVTDGYNIFSAILDSKTPVDTYAKGMVASIAGPIFMAGRKRYMTDYSTLMMHNPFGGDDKKMLGVMKDSIATMIAAKSNLPMSQVNYMMDKTTWMNPSECLEHGFCNEIEVTSQGNKKWAAQPKAEYKACNQIINNFLKTQNSMDTPTGKVIGLSLIANYLGLNTEATENSILTEVQNRINTEILNRNKAEGETAQAKKDLEKCKAEMEEAKNQFTEKCAAYDALVAKNAADAADVANKIKLAQDAAAAVEIKNVVEGFAKLGKIKNEEVDGWVDDAKLLGIEKVKARLEALPLNKVANKLNVIEGGAATGYNAATIMATIAAKTAKA
jgi:ATP-dependent protease ClpP protease subunit